MDEAEIESIVDDLADRGFSKRNDFLSAPDLEALIQEERELWEENAFRAAAIGRGAETAVHTEIRGDRICWLDPTSLTPATAAYWSRIDELRLSINRMLYLGLTDFEAHFAVYPPGSFYKKHLDQHRGKSRRTISCLLYLNPGWNPEDGGQLRLYESGGTTDILPDAGTFVCFRSDTVYHEVMPTRRERMSITGWLRRVAV
jgi:SM-20-related protein